MAQKRKGPTRPQKREKAVTYGVLGGRIAPDAWVPPVVDWVSDRLRALEVARLDIVAEQVKTVQHARSVGMTWEQIGDAMGITRQTAHQRWGAAS